MTGIAAPGTPQRAPAAPARPGRAGRVRLSWLAPALLRPNLTELEVEDIVQTLVARFRGGTVGISDETIREVTLAQVGIAPRPSDLDRIRAQLLAAGCPLSG